MSSPPPSRAPAGCRSWSASVTVPARARIRHLSPPVPRRVDAHCMLGPWNRLLARTRPRARAAAGAAASPMRARSLSMARACHERLRANWTSGVGRCRIRAGRFVTEAHELRHSAGAPRRRRRHGVPAPHLRQPGRGPRGGTEPGGHAAVVHLHAGARGLRRDEGRQRAAVPRDGDDRARPQRRDAAPRTARSRRRRRSSAATT